MLTLEPEKTEPAALQKEFLVLNWQHVFMLHLQHYRCKRSVNVKNPQDSLQLLERNSRDLHPSVPSHLSGVAFWVVSPPGCDQEVGSFQRNETLLQRSRSGLTMCAILNMQWSVPLRLCATESFQVFHDVVDVLTNMFNWFHRRLPSVRSPRWLRRRSHTGR